MLRYIGGDGDHRRVDCGAQVAISALIRPDSRSMTFAIARDGGSIGTALFVQERSADGSFRHSFRGVFELLGHPTLKSKLIVLLGTVPAAWLLGAASGNGTF
jgi:hypothetical protein